MCCHLRLSMQFCSWMWVEQVCVSGRLSVPSSGSCLCVGSSSEFLIPSGLSSWLFAVLRMGSCLSSCSSSTCRSGFPFLSLPLVSRSADTSCTAVGTVMTWRSFEAQQSP
ncbi:Os07g0654100 [Oryza sativa Japonica Group]|uniref:Os07g0654100 protein n=2 Tax=Oryza sativa subsp. japonica TaxID=39947 RepID=Q0D418_ORYSJ|nr:Os07g0654100 [Oryza sativa Japonica Group]BAT02981.1 Os07g0654100 [Oryza sativa Japonica Group]|eukprot:NP_001060491.1 Os07g0654100 [Oryza sativa Japonica Group]